MAISLLEKCSQYEKSASSDLKVSKVEVVKNSDPFFKRLSDIKEFDDRVKFAKEKFQLLGTGSARTVFKMNDDLILKVAHNDRGSAQNLAEAKPELQKDCIANVVVADSKGKWLVSHFTDTMTKDDFKHVVGFGFTEFMNALFYAYNNESDKWPEPRKYDEIRKHPLFDCLGSMVVDGSILLGDVDKTSSWGMKNGKVLLRDWGLSKSVFHDYYADPDDSTSNSPNKTSE